MVRRHALGVHVGHDRGAALVSGGELVAQVAEERLDRKKHSNSPDLPLHSIQAVLDIGRVRPDELGIAGISYTNVEIGRVSPLLRDELRDCLSTPELEVVGIDHHDCHAWSAYCTSDSNAALVVVADGSGDICGNRLEAESAYVGSGNTIALLERRLQDFGSARLTRRNSFLLPYMSDLDRKKDISLGHKYEQFTYMLGFGQRESGKTMGLAAYGAPLCQPEVPRFQGLQFSLQYESSLVEIDGIWQASGEPWHRFIRRRARDIAATGQLLLERYVIAMLNALNPNGSHNTLCAAGGVFLNCQMNGLILANTKFRKVHIIPAAGDDGLSVGAAFYAYAQTFGPPLRSANSLPFLGPNHNAVQIEESLNRAGLNSEKMTESELANRLADDLAAGKVLGLLRGRSEMGPRALCHRSILADPRAGGMKDHLNRLKGRELFRPFAPVVTEEDQCKFFELAERSPYMLFATRLRAPFLAALPAIVHVDGSSRVQSVSRQQEPFVHALLRCFESRTGYPILLNTSFNLAEEPIVESPADAIAAYMNSALDVLAMEGFYVNDKARRQCKTT